jgi:hypothetical protein
MRETAERVEQERDEPDQLAAPMNLIALLPVVPRAEYRLLDRESLDWRSLRGQYVLVVSAGVQPALPVLRAAMANDCRLDLLDVDAIDLLSAHYDGAAHRRFKASHGIPLLAPALIGGAAFLAARLMRELGLSS